MTDNKNKLENVNAGENVVAVNYSQTDVENNYYPRDEDVSLKERLNKITVEMMQSPELQKCIESLREYSDPYDSRDKRDLETKLKESGRKDEIFEANRQKEIFSKILYKSNLSTHAQEAYVLILGKLRFDYEMEVKPLIKEGRGPSIIDAKIKKIVDVMFSNLSETSFERDHIKIRGMLYFLAGNCYIEWKY